MSTVDQANAYRKRHIAAGICVECLRPILTPYKRFCARHLLAHRIKTRVAQNTQPYDGTTGRRPFISDEDLERKIAEEDAA